MAIPSDFSITNLVTESLKRGGIVAPSSQQVTDGTNYALREVGKDILLVVGELPQLRTTAVTTTTVGKSVYDWPTDATEIGSVVLLAAPDSHSGTAQAGGSTSITLALSFTEQPDNLKGKWIVVTGGTGANQIRQIIDYNDSTKVVTVDTAWTTNPAVSSTYAIPTLHRRLFHTSKNFEHDFMTAPYDMGRAVNAAMQGRTIWLNYVPDRQYVLWWDYFVDIDRIDTAGSVYLRIIRDYFNLFIVGIAAKVMDRFDDARAQAQLGKYHAMLEMLSSRATTIRQVNFTDV